jgi:hypothetical protein
LVRLGVDDGDAAGRGAVDVAAERCGATFGAAIAGLGGAFLAPVARFGLGFCALIFVVRRTVVFAAGLVAFIVRLTSCFAAAALPVFSLALPACLIGRFATVTLRVFSLALANRLIGRLAMVLRPSFFVLTAAIPAADFRLTGFAGRLAFVARPDDFDALLFVETAAAIGPSPYCLRRSPALLNYAFYRWCSSLSRCGSSAPAVGYSDQSGPHFVSGAHNPPGPTRLQESSMIAGTMEKKLPVGPASAFSNHLAFGA